MSVPAKPINLTASLATPTKVGRQFRLLFRAEEPIVKFDIGAFEGKDSIN